MNEQREQILKDRANKEVDTIIRLLKHVGNKLHDNGQTHQEFRPCVSSEASMRNFTRHIEELTECVEFMLGGHVRRLKETTRLINL